MIDLDAMRRQLLDRQQELEQLNDESSESRSTVKLDQQSVGRLSRMDAMQQQAMAQATQQQRQRELIEIRAALQRMEQDDYGFCEDCGAEIAAKRLQLYPTARYCVECQQQRE